jgi:hypothetical protein
MEFTHWAGSCTYGVHCAVGTTKTFDSINRWILSQRYNPNTGTWVSAPAVYSAAARTAAGAPFNIWAGDVMIGSTNNFSQENFTVHFTNMTSGWFVEN